MPCEVYKGCNTHGFSNRALSNAYINASGALNAVIPQLVVAEWLPVDHSFSRGLGWIVIAVESCHHSALL